MFNRTRTIVVHKDEEIPFDGKVIEGVALVNECTVTGVSTPVLIDDQAGHNDVIAGGVVVDGSLTIRSKH